MALLLHHLANLLPLGLSGINARGVVSASMEKDDALRRGRLEIRNQTLKVKPNGVLIVVAVLLDLEAGILEDGTVVRPAGGWDVDLLSVGIESLEERSSNAESTGSRDGLGNSDAALLDGSGVGAIGKFSSGLCESGNTGDSGILLVETVVHELRFGCSNGREDIWLALVVTWNAKSTGQR